MPKPPAAALAAARATHERVEKAEKTLLKELPDAWAQMDRMRAQPGVAWPPWCLLPMAAAAAAAQPLGPAAGPRIGEIAALYTYRHARAVYIVETTLMTRLLTQVPDHLTLDDLTGLPHWCVCVAGETPDIPVALWAHLEYDYATGRPELRLLLDVDDTRVPIPVYLDRPSLTEAVADSRATALSSARDVRGGDLDETVARFADQLDGYLALLAYLSRPEADIRCVSRPGQRPVRPRSPVRDRTVWAVGYSG